MRPRRVQARRRLDVCVRRARGLALHWRGGGSQSWKREGVEGGDGGRSEGARDGGANGGTCVGIGGGGGDLLGANVVLEDLFEVFVAAEGGAPVGVLEGFGEGSDVEGIENWVWDGRWWGGHCGGCAGSRLWVIWWR